MASSKSCSYSIRWGCLCIILLSSFLQSKAYLSSFIISWITVVGEKGIILRSRDGGLSWKYQNSGTNETLNDVFFSSVRNGFIVGNNATLITTTDAGLQWNPATAGDQSIADFDFFGVGYFPPTQLIAVVGEQGLIVISTDGGNTWSMGQLAASCFSSYSTVCAANSTVQSSSESRNLFKVKFFDTVNGVIIGDTPNIFITSDGGLTFSIVTPIDATVYPGASFTDVDQDQVAHPSSQCSHKDSPPQLHRLKSRFSICPIAC